MDLGLRAVSTKKTRRRSAPDSAALLLDSNTILVQRNEVHGGPSGQTGAALLPHARPPTLPRLPPANHITRNGETKRTLDLITSFHARDRAVAACASVPSGNRQDSDLHAQRDDMESRVRLD